MAEILMSGATEILKKLVGVVSEDIASAWDVKDDLKKLQSTSEMILAVIGDAEKRQNKEELVRLWLRRLKDLAYDADDVIDEFSYEDKRRCDIKDSLKHKVFNLTSSSSKPPLAFRIKMGKKIKNINKRFENITQDMDKFQLEFTKPIPDGESTQQLHREYTSHVIESEIVGRENDKSHIIKLLTTHTTSSSSSSSSSSLSSENISVISIVGMGGLGKTTLAQLVYKDEWVVNKVFELTMWVQVSEIFDIEIILVKLMESITQTKFHKPLNFHVLVNIVQKKLNGKKYLLVLDDLWNEDAQQWGCLMSVLLAGAPGSKILITTRNDQVASVVRGSIPPYNLNLLPDDSCWSIIKKKAFSPGGALDGPEMSDIGKEIAKKCCGLPLAAKFLGSLMRLKNKESDWVSIRDDDIWNTPESKKRILPVLKLSYNYLPSHLKQCFSYCSIFPKNWEISKETLVHLWMAEGFLKQSNNIKNKRSIEDFGRDYFDFLAWSSFFQDFKKNFLGDIETCKMHDLVHDLAKDVVGENELVSLKVSELKDVSEVRRLQLDMDEDISATSLRCIGKWKKLRTLFISEDSIPHPSIFSGKNHLRILHVGPSPHRVYRKWPSLSLLKHLRYLRLTSLDLREVEKDQSINELYSLETLVLNEVTGVQIQILLSNIQSLKNLRYLEVSSTFMEELPDSVTSLCNLQTLDLNHCQLKVIPESISGLKKLRFLNLSFNPIEELPVSILTLSMLQTLDVNTCKNLKALPEFVADLANLKIFHFKNCPLLEALPKDFGELTQLRCLDLNGTGIKVLPDSCANLSNVEYMNLFDCELPKDVKSWTRLRNFIYSPLGKPIVPGIGKLVCLESLLYTVPAKPINEPTCSIVGIEELGNLNFLEELVIVNLENAKDPIDAVKANLKGKHNLRALVLFWRQLSRNIQVFEALQPPTCLRGLTIINFMGCDLPTWIPSGVPNLDKLVIKNCSEIKQLPTAIGQLLGLRVFELGGMSLKNLDIGGFPSLLELVLTDMFLLEELCYSYPSLTNLWIVGCKRLTETPLFPSLTTLLLENVDLKLVCSVGRSQTSLTTLYLVNIEELIYFPASILQKNRDIQILVIRKCNQFEGFGVNDDRNEKESSNFHIGSLQKLGVLDCPVLKILPDLSGWTALKDLSIFNCPQVKESLTYDLKKLSFLNELYVDFIQRDEQRGDTSTYEDLINLLD